MKFYCFFEIGEEPEKIKKTHILSLDSKIQNFFIYTFFLIADNSSIRSDSGGFPILLHVNVFPIFFTDNHGTVRYSAYSEIGFKFRAPVYICGHKRCFSRIFFCQFLKSWSKSPAMGAPISSESQKNRTFLEGCI